MKKGETKVIKNKNKPNEIAVVEKVIDTKPKKIDLEESIRLIYDDHKTLEKKVNHLEKDMGQLISKVSSGFNIIDDVTSDILKKINKVNKRLGIS